MKALLASATLLLASPVYAGGVAFTFDDGFESMREIVLPIMIERGIVGTIFVTTGALDEKGYIRSSDVNSFVEAGWELGAHSIAHESFTEMGATALRANLFQPLSVLKKLTGYDVISVASPFGNYDDQVLTTASSYYDIHVNAWSDANGNNDWSTIDPMNINRWTIRSTDTVDAVCDRIKAQKNDGVFAIAFHNVTEDEPSQDRIYDISSDTLKGIIDCVITNNIYHFRVRDIIGE